MCWVPLGWPRTICGQKIKRGKRSSSWRRSWSLMMPPKIRPWIIVWKTLKHAILHIYSMEFHFLERWKKLTDFSRLNLQFFTFGKRHHSIKNSWFFAHVLAKFIFGTFWVHLATFLISWDVTLINLQAFDFKKQHTM